MPTQFLHDDAGKKRSFLIYPTCFGITACLISWLVIGIPKLPGDLHPIASLEIPGWKMADEQYRFDPQNLYEYIDGAADFFVAYGFVSLEGANYFSDSDVDNSVTIDVYDMGKKLNAFGVFQTKKPKKAPTLNIGAASFGADGYLAFYKDRYFVEIFSFVKSIKWKDYHLDIARRLVELIQGDILPPDELNYFPELGRIKGSERYIKGGILGHAFLDRGIVCSYTAENETVSAFLAFLPSEEDAVKSFELHMNFLHEFGKCIPFDGLGERGLVAQEPYHKTIILIQKGPFVIGVYDLSSVQKGKKILKNMVKRLDLQSNAHQNIK